LRGAPDAPARRPPAVFGASCSFKRKKKKEAKKKKENMYK
jgi:hypothetical protein